MDRPLAALMFALAGLASCDSVGEPVSSAPIVYQEASSKSADRVMRCFDGGGVKISFPGIEYFGIAAGRVGAPDAGGYRSADGTSIAVISEYPHPTKVIVRAHKPLTQGQRALLATCG